MPKKIKVAGTPARVNGLIHILHVEWEKGKEEAKS